MNDRRTVLVLAPGIQGRAEFHAPTADALSRSHRVLTFSLARARRSSEWSASDAIDVLSHQIDRALDDAGASSAVVCGVSFGGLVALRFAARCPERTLALILASVPGPDWRPTQLQRIFIGLPWLAVPVFLLGAPSRLGPEIAAALPDWRARRAFARWSLRTYWQAPVWPSDLAARATLIGYASAAEDCARVTAPTLVITGEKELDRIVPVEGTMAYARLIAGARAVTIAHTGHLGSVTRSEAFATAVQEFLGRGPVRVTDAA